MLSIPSFNDLFPSIRKIRKSLVFKLIFAVEILLLICISIWAFFTIRFQQDHTMETIVAGTDRLTRTIRLGTHYAMMLNSREDITQIIRNIGRQENIGAIRIYNKDGRIQFSNNPDEIDRKTNIKSEACYICHRTEPPQLELSIKDRIRFFDDPDNGRFLGMIAPIYNEPGCSPGPCHVHSHENQVLGAMDLVVSLDETDRMILAFEKGIFFFAVAVFLVTSALIFFFLIKFVNRPIGRLIRGTRRIAAGDFSRRVKIPPSYEIGQLAVAFNQMTEELQQKEEALRRQQNEYRQLFEQAPCYITVQDRDFKLSAFNREFSDTFAPEEGAYCFYAYKGRTEKCENCPVEKTFADGKSHSSEETGVSKDGEITHWIVRTAPVKDDEGNIVAAMEMCLDVTRSRILEDKLKSSEKKYYAVFNNIPNPIFVLDAHTLEILDCNKIVKTVYGYEKDELIFTSFLDFFPPGEQNEYQPRLEANEVLNRVKHIGKNNRVMFVDIWISPAEYAGKSALLVVTNDITQRLETESQLTQAGKMATLGEMATGIAHELNQPLTVIKTAGAFLMRKTKREESVEPGVLSTMSEKIDRNVDRATKIINHMRQFARKTDMTLEWVDVNDVLAAALEIFNQQLKLRGIETTFDLDPDLPRIRADAGRLEQVFVNLFVNSRDAIEEKMEAAGADNTEKRIIVKTLRRNSAVHIEFIDTGKGIPAEIVDKIFEPFYTTKEVGKGTGLGLSISYGIVKDFGGDIRAVSKPSRGAVFELIFPVPEKGNNETVARRTGKAPKTPETDVSS